MNQNLDLLKKELSLEIKEIAKEIANVESYSGLLTHEIKFRTLYEKFIVLKFLDKKRIYIEDLNLPTEQPLEQDVIEKEVEEEVIINLNDDVEDIKNETIENTENIETPTPIEGNNHLSPIRLDLNDKIAFRSLLFNGDTDSMDLVLKTLNRINDLPSSLQYLEELKKEMEWGTEVDEYLERLKDLILKRFNY